RLKSAGYLTSPNRDNACCQTGSPEDVCARAGLIVEMPRAGAIAVTAPPCKRCLRLTAKGEILSLPALSRAQYRARFRAIRLVFAHHNTAYVAKGPGHEIGTGRKPWGNRLGTRLDRQAKRPGVPPAVAQDIASEQLYLAAVGNGAG